MTVALGPGLCAGNFLFFWEQKMTTLLIQLLLVLQARVWQNFSSSSSYCLVHSYSNFTFLWNLTSDYTATGPLSHALDRSFYRRFPSSNFLLQGESLHVVCELFGVKKAQKSKFRYIRKSKLNIRKHPVNYFRKQCYVNFFIFTLHKFHLIPCDWERTWCHPSSPLSPQQNKSVIQTAAKKFKFFSLLNTVHSVTAVWLNNLEQTVAVRKYGWKHCLGKIKSEAPQTCTVLRSSAHSSRSQSRPFSIIVINRFSTSLFWFCTVSGRPPL